MWKQVELHSGQVTLTLDAKSGKTLYDKLSRPVNEALMSWLYRWYGAEIGQFAARAKANIRRKRMATSKIHALRHMFAHRMEAADAPVAEIQARHGSA
ncbi:MAG TPA: hypothetical protein VE338_02415 [Ktedonobacterales bacterium]|jgi:hypothetical protein|nr:hypothetical protein [Ktedonobacterales bacterium]